MALFSNYIRGFNVVKWWRLYTSAQKHKGFLKEIYTALYMRMATKGGGYVGRNTRIAGIPNLPHGFHGIHISKDAILGKNCIIYQNVTIGNYEGIPCIGDNVLIGANAIVLGSVTIGNNAKIGAGAIVVSDVPAGATAVGGKAHIIKGDSKVENAE